MIECKKFIEDVESNKDKIAFALAMTFANGDSRRANSYFENFYNVLTNNNKTFFLSYDNGYSSEYEKRTDNLLIELYELMDFEVAVNAYKEYFVEDYDGVNDYIIKSAKKSFEKNYGTYAKRGIDFNKFLKIYIEGKAGKLDELLASIEKEMRMYSLKRELSIYKEMLMLPLMNKRYAKLCDIYNVSKMNDLLTLNTEIDSFFVDESKLDDNSRSIIENNRNSFRKRINKGNDFYLSESEAEKIKKNIEQVYNYNVYREMFSNTNLEEFIQDNHIEVNEKNLKLLSECYFKLVSEGVDAFRLVVDFGYGETTYCFYRDKSIAYNSESQNNTILHESIHVLEGKNNGKKSKKINSNKYKSLNEALTEYLAKEACTYLDENILSKSGKADSGGSVYDSMLPLVEELRHSGIWEDILKAKLLGNVEQLENKIGVSNFNDICKCFDRAYNNFDDQVIEKCKKDLISILRMGVKKSKK